MTDNMGWVILDALSEQYKDDKQLYIDCIVYLYLSTADIKLKEQIEDICEEMGYCCTCGNKLVEEIIQETHTELCGSPIEEYAEYYCPYCD